MTIGKVSLYGTAQLISVDKVKTSPFQVRKRYGDIEGLATDIKAKGLLQPILVRPVKDYFEIVHGHRRFKALQLNKATHITCFVKELTDLEAIQVQGSENLKRKDYDAIEEGTLYKNYQEAYERLTGKSITHEQIADAFSYTGTSRRNVGDKMALLMLPKDIQEKIINGELTYRKARPLLPLVGYGRGVHASSPEQFFFEIHALVDEIEKGEVKGGFVTRDAITTAAQLILAGKPLNLAIDEAKTKEAVELAHKQVEAGKTAQQIIDEIYEKQKDPQKVVAVFFDLYVEQLRDNMKKGAIKCPYCGKTDCLHWSCVDKGVLEDEENGQIGSLQ